MSQFLVNGNLVNTRTDWRHLLLPGPVMSRTEHHFPGVAQRFVTKGDVYAPDIILVGFLELEASSADLAISGLMDIEELWGEYKATGPHTITYAGKSYENVELLELFPVDPEVVTAAASVSTNHLIMRQWQWHWRQLSK